MTHSPPDDAGEALHLQPASSPSATPDGRRPQQAEVRRALPLGADPSSVDAIEGHYIQTQQGLERGYWLGRQAQARGRLLANVAHDAMLLLDAHTLQVLEANPAAIALFAEPAATLIGQPLRPCVVEALRPALDDLLHGAVANGQAAEVRLALTSSQGAIELAASPAWAGRQRCLVLRGRRTGTDASAAAQGQAAADDAAAVTNAQGRVLGVNTALLAWCGAADAAAVEGQPLADVLGGPPAQWAALLARVAERRVLGQVAISVRGPGGPGAPHRPALVSAAALSESDSEQFGFTLRWPCAAAATPATAGRG